MNALSVGGRPALHQLVGAREGPSSHGRVDAPVDLSLEIPEPVLHVHGSMVPGGCDSPGTAGAESWLDDRVNDPGVVPAAAWKSVHLA